MRQRTVLPSTGRVVVALEEEMEIAGFADFDVAGCVMTLPARVA